MEAFRVSFTYGSGKVRSVWKAVPDALTDAVTDAVTDMVQRGCANDRKFAKSFRDDRRGSVVEFANRDRGLIYKAPQIGTANLPCLPALVSVALRIQRLWYAGANKRSIR